MIAKHNTSHGDRFTALPRVFAEIISHPHYGTMLVHGVGRCAQAFPDGTPRPAHVPDHVVHLYSEAHDLHITTEVRNVKFILNGRAKAAGQELLEEITNTIIEGLGALELYLQMGILSTENADSIKPELNRVYGEELTAYGLHAIHSVEQLCTDRRYEEDKRAYDEQAPAPFFEESPSSQAERDLRDVIKSTLAYLAKVKGETRH